MASFRSSATILALTSSLFCSMPFEVQAAPELAVTAKETPNAQRAAYANGKQAAQRDDAEGAVEAWADVLTATPESIENRRFRMHLILDTIYVALDAHARQPNRPLLERALDIYYAYFSAHKTQYGTPNIPGPVVDARFELKATLGEAAPQTGATNEMLAEPPPPQPAEDRSASVPPSTSDRGPASSGEGTGLIIAGGVTVAIAAGLTSLIAVGAINGKRAREDLEDPAYSPEQRSRIDAQGEKANTMFIAGLVSAPVVLATGAVLIGIGAKRHIYSRRAYAKLIPTVSRSFAGVQIHGRF